VNFFFSKAFHINSGVHTVSYLMSTGVLSRGQICRNVKLATHLCLLPRLELHVCSPYMPSWSAQDYTFTFNFTVNCVMQYDHYGESELSYPESIVRRFGDVIILERLIEFFAGILRLCCWAACRTGSCLTHIQIGDSMS